MNKLTTFSRAILAIVIMLCVALPTLAHDFEVDGIYYNYLDETAKTVEVTYRGSSYSAYYDEYTGSVTIPSSVTYSGTTYSVTSIGSEAFSYCSGLTSVTISNSVTSIGFKAFYGTAWYNNLADGVIYINNVLYKYKGSMPNGTSISVKDGTVSISPSAFDGCSGLTSITIPNSVTSIGYSAFRDCSSLTSVTIGNSVTSIGNSAFLGCSGLTSITIPNSVTSIADYAFYRCSGLTSITIPNSVTSIGNCAFSDCDGLTEVIVENGNSKYDSRDNCNAIVETATNTLILGCKNSTIPNSVTSIGSSAFRGCSGLTSVTIGNSVTTIGDYAFKGCDGLSSVTIGNSVTSIGDEAFNGCDGLTSVTIGNSVTSIGDYAFNGCDGLISVTIPNSVTSIGSSAFYNCTGLTSITIPNSVTTIGDKAFYGTAWYNNLADGVIYINNVLYEYKGRMPNGKSISVKDGTVSISPYAFSGRSGLTSITIPNSVTTIGDKAFENCTGLTSVTIGNSVTLIGFMAFYNCTGLTSITIPNSVTKIGSCAFYNCSGLTSVTIGNSVTTIGSFAFYNCSGLTSVTIGNSVTTIGDYAFNGCDGLISVTIGNSVTSIGESAFSSCDGLTKLILEDGAESISGLSFPSSPIETLYLGRITSDTFVKGKTTLKEVTIGNSVNSIGSSAFEGCTGLTEVNISDLSAWCKIDFSNYSANPLYYAKEFKLNGIEIKDLVIPNDITEIKNYAFYRCSGLTSITIPNSVTSIGNSAFGYCKGLTSVTIPNSVTSIGNSAFGDCSGLTSVTIGNSVDSIGSYAFSGCTRLTDVNISDLSAWCKIDFSNKESNPLYYAEKLKLNGSEIKDLVIPNDITEIKNYAFIYCTGLTSVTIPNSVTSIGGGAFYSCDGLTSVAIPNSVTEIGNSAFSYCRGLTSATIGNSVTSIGNYAFSDCYDLKYIVSLNTLPPVCASSSSFDENNYEGATLYVPKDSYAKYFIDDVWGQFTNIKKIEILVSSITLNNSSIELDKGNTATLSATIAPSNATIKNIVWTSSNPQIATVDQSGKVTAFTHGTATITAKSIDGSNVSASCKVTVNGPTITLSQIEATLPVNEIMTLSYSITNSATKTATWSTSNEYVAYVKTNSDGSATIVGMADGVATITATMVDNGQEYSASCVVTVGVGGVEGVEMDNNAVEVSRYDIHGRLLSEPTPGINIVKMSNGTTRKEIVKN